MKYALELSRSSPSNHANTPGGKPVKSGSMPAASRNRGTATLPAWPARRRRLGRDPAGGSPFARPRRSRVLAEAVAARRHLRRDDPRAGADRAGPRHRLMLHEHTLLAAARSGDQNAFGQLVEPFAGELHAHCYRMLGSVQDAEDALQDALLRAWRGLARFDGRGSLRAWLYRIATNTGLDLIARRPSGSCRSSTAGRPTRGSARRAADRAVWLEPYPDARLGDGLRVARGALRAARERRARLRRRAAAPPCAPARRADPARGARLLRPRGRRDARVHRGVGQQRAAAGAQGDRGAAARAQPAGHAAHARRPRGPRARRPLRRGLGARRRRHRRRHARRGRGPLDAADAHLVPRRRHHHLPHRLGLLRARLRRRGRPPRPRAPDASERPAGLRHLRLEPRARRPPADRAPGPHARRRRASTRSPASSCRSSSPGSASRPSCPKWGQTLFRFAAGRCGRGPGARDRSSPCPHRDTVAGPGPVPSPSGATWPAPGSAGQAAPGRCGGAPAQGTGLRLVHTATRSPGPDQSLHRAADMAGARIGRASRPGRSGRGPGARDRSSRCPHRAHGRRARTSPFTERREMAGARIGRASRGET